MTYLVEYLPRLNRLSIEIVDGAFHAVTGAKLEGDQFITISIRAKDLIKIRCPLAVKSATPTSVKTLGSNLQISLEVDPQIDTELANNVGDGPDKWSCGWLKSHTSKLGSKNEFQFRCSNCQLELIDSLDFIFKDMPGDYWYELMEFWHCHKPENNQPTDKDYGILKPKNNNTIIIGSFYLLQTINKSLQLLESDGDEALYVCKACRQVIGDKFQNVIRLLKWKLDLKFTAGSGTLISIYNPLLYAVNLFTTKMQSLAIRKFAIEVDAKSVYLWILNTDVDVTIDGRDFRKCLKVLWFSIAKGGESYGGYEQMEIPYKEVRDKLSLALQENTIHSNVEIGSIKYLISYLPTLV